MCGGIFVCFLVSKCLSVHWCVSVGVKIAGELACFGMFECVYVCVCGGCRCVQVLGCLGVGNWVCMLRCVSVCVWVYGSGGCGCVQTLGRLVALVCVSESVRVVGVCRPYGVWVRECVGV